MTSASRHGPGALCARQPLAAEGDSFSFPSFLLLGSQVIVFIDNSPPLCSTTSILFNYVTAVVASLV